MRVSSGSCGVRVRLVAGLLFCAASVPAMAGETPVGATTFGATLFIDASHLDQGGSASNGADLTRFYLDLDHRLSQVWSAHLTTDINWLRDQSPTDLWFKRAYVQGAFSKGLTLRLGSADLPWAGFVNSWSGYRYVDKELLTRLKFAASADWGAHVLGTLGGSGQVQYATSMITGSGFKKPRTGSRPDVEARVAWQPTAQTIIAIGGYDGTRAMDGGPQASHHTARRWEVMLGYVDNRFRLGGQYFHASDWNQVTSPASDHASGWSAWASMNLAPQWSLFARHDDARPSESLHPALHDRYSNLGREWRIQQSVRVAVVYKHARPASTTTNLPASNELGLWAQIAL